MMEEGGKEGGRERCNCPLNGKQSERVRNAKPVDKSEEEEEVEEVVLGNG